MSRGRRALPRPRRRRLLNAAALLAIVAVGALIGYVLVQLIG